eukprot:533208-Pelagomonas_calceolata.AAC.4
MPHPQPIADCFYMRDSPVNHTTRVAMLNDQQHSARDGCCIVLRARFQALGHFAAQMNDITEQQAWCTEGGYKI